MNKPVVVGSLELSWAEAAGTKERVDDEGEAENEDEGEALEWTGINLPHFLQKIWELSRNGLKKWSISRDSQPNWDPPKKIMNMNISLFYWDLIV